MVLVDVVLGIIGTDHSRARWLFSASQVPQLLSPSINRIHLCNLDTICRIFNCNCNDFRRDIKLHKGKSTCFENRFVNPFGLIQSSGIIALMIVVSFSVIGAAIAGADIPAAPKIVLALFSPVAFNNAIYVMAEAENRQMVIDDCAAGKSCATC